MTARVSFTPRRALEFCLLLAASPGDRPRDSCLFAGLLRHTGPDSFSTLLGSHELARARWPGLIRSRVTPVQGARMDEDPLGLDPETMRRLGYQTVDLLVDRWVGLRKQPVLRRGTPTELAHRPTWSPAPATSRPAPGSRRLIPARWSSWCWAGSSSGSATPNRQPVSWSAAA